MVIAVEPDPENFEYLEKNVKLNGMKNVVLINKALSNYVKSARGYRINGILAHGQ